MVGFAWNDKVEVDGIYSWLLSVVKDGKALTAFDAPSGDVHVPARTTKSPNLSNRAVFCPRTTPHPLAMPPRLQILRSALERVSLTAYQPLAPFLYPVICQQRAASILSSLSDTKGAYNKRIRRGRGPSSGKGKTSGRGHKGQKQHGKVPAGFNGGQTADEIVAGKRGFHNPYAALSPT